MLQYSDFCILLRMNALSRSMEEGSSSLTLSALSPAYVPATVS